MKIKKMMVKRCVLPYTDVKGETWMEKAKRKRLEAFEMCYRGMLKVECVKRITNKFLREK